MPQTLKLAVSQSHTLSTLSETLAALKTTAESAASKGVDILLFPEAYLGGYPRTCSFGAAIGSRSEEGREQFLQYYRGSVDLGDTNIGEADGWLQRKLPVDPETGRRGDGTREFLEQVANQTGVFVVTGLVERTSTGSLFCAALYICPKRGVIGKRRKLMPTGSERLVWSQGTAGSLKVVTATIKGVKVVMGCAICWENMMPLLRYSLYSQAVNLWLAPTADPRDTWGALVQTIAMEGRCFVMSANQCQKRSQLPEWITTTQAQIEGERPSRRKSVTTKENHEIALPSGKNEKKVNGDSTIADMKDEYVSRGGSCIVSPMGQFVKAPVWENSDELITADVDFDTCVRGKLDFDAAGHYSRYDAFKFSVEGLDLRPPP
ncbi:hypothetical protein H2198_003304 [Neophaeococcomyces mojaviensis]|uniref:Uncharacterized protein n=1 Tax=Neophaeococcomyces mojaviensis TaxID=3383035 RepID=A0ACC3AC82_9EURO|nr:hypothetical protein H2198_003304 [Knufia sp. JES_112]